MHMNQFKDLLLTFEHLIFNENSILQVKRLFLILSILTSLSFLVDGRPYYFRHYTNDNGLFEQYSDGRHTGPERLYVVCHQGRPLTALTAPGSGSLAITRHYQTAFRQLHSVTMKIIRDGYG